MLSAIAQRSENVFEIPIVPIDEIPNFVYPLSGRFAACNYLPEQTASPLVLAAFDLTSSVQICTLLCSFVQWFYCQNYCHVTRGPSCQERAYQMVSLSDELSFFTALAAPRLFVLHEHRTTSNKRTESEHVSYESGTGLSTSRCSRIWHRFPVLLCSSA